jgi:hypothetical protein
MDLFHVPHANYYHIDMHTRYLTVHSLSVDRWTNYFVMSENYIPTQTSSYVTVLFLHQPHNSREKERTSNIAQK